MCSASAQMFYDYSDHICICYVFVILCINKLFNSIQFNSMDGWMDGWKDGYMDVWMDVWMDGRMDRWMDGWMYG